MSLKEDRRPIPIRRNRGRQWNQNPHATIRELGSKLGTSHTAVLKHLRAINKKKKLDSYVPYELTQLQMIERKSKYASLLLRNKRLPFLIQITCDEKWILYDYRKRSSKRVDKYTPPR
ncbi:histone-lysine N-methyltransferase SETMAR [Nephila pilipes]|uniref:Histone-lysine N-methyltransferase SETMAR n=1 Tax=Nephila pilipes TaxID=299642 RepID=A0A8X6P7C9_NEPPI|nr:histone-lysine N-methyltransferase SETMAR [Nephila pilipes]